MSDDILERTEAALAPLWSKTPPGPINLSQSPAYIAFKQFCADSFPAADKGMGFSFGLSDALRGAGLPCLMSQPRLASTLEEGSRAIVAAFGATAVRRTYICPLDLADTLPPMVFGKAIIRRYGKEELATLFDAVRLARYFPGQAFEAGDLAQFQWLTVEETVPVASRAGQRALPWLYERWNRDFGAFDPHAGAHPGVVADILFALLLAPWEDWHSLDTDWVGFNIPWVHLVTDDLFVRPKPVPSAGTLTWEDAAYQDDDGEMVEYQRPFTVPLYDAAQPILAACDPDWWARIETAAATPLFETPVKHFLVRAAFSDGMDQIMAHMTAIEAALGLQSDFSKKGRPKHDQIGATARLAKRVAILLGDPQAGQDYAELFALRSAFVHGRPIAGQISGKDRTLARRLARRVVVALVDAANGMGSTLPRADFLNGLA